AVGGPDAAVAERTHPVRVRKRSFTPRLHVLAVRVENDHLGGRIVALEAVDVSGGVDRDRRHRAPRVTGRQLRPVVDAGVAAPGRDEWICGRDDGDSCDNCSSESPHHGIAGLCVYLGGARSFTSSEVIVGIPSFCDTSPVIVTVWFSTGQSFSLLFAVNPPAI